MNAIEVTDAALAYRVMHDRAPSLKEAAINLARGRTPRFERLWALENVSLSVRPGETLGIIGANGAGKSTLLRLIAGVVPPTRGRVVVRGRVGAMIELGAGFNPELTGTQNVLLYGSMLGVDTHVLRGEMPAIADWAGLTDFMDVPLRSYSSGMTARLGFAVTTHLHPDVLLVDEVLAVGDATFQARSSERMTSLMASGAAVVIVSHDLGAIVRLCDRVLWIESGHVVCSGAPHDVAAAYQASADAALESSRAGEPRAAALAAVTEHTSV